MDAEVYHAGEVRPILYPLELCGSTITLSSIGCERILRLVAAEVPTVEQDTIELRLVDPLGGCDAYDYLAPATFDLGVLEVAGRDSVVVEVFDRFITWRYQ